MSQVRILRSAYKHGITNREIYEAMTSPIRRGLIGEDPTKWVYRGFTHSGKALEIISIMGDDGTEVVIHAMKLRKHYQPRRGQR